MDDEERAAPLGDCQEARSVSRQGNRSSRRLSKRGGVWPLLALLLAVQLSWSLYQLPVNRVIERRLCRGYYRAHDPTVINPDGGVDEELCKVNEIQQHLAWILGAMETAWIVGGTSSRVVIDCVVPIMGLDIVVRIASSS